MSTEEELAYRYDLFITPEWRDRFDRLVDENIKLPVEGRVLEVNCGTGSYAIRLAERLRDKGEVVAIDPSPARVDLASAKASVLKIEDITFQLDECLTLPFRADEFDAVVGDASLLRIADIEPLLVEMVRVTRPENRVVLKMTTRGSFDEFFSIYWEALLECGVIDEVWGSLERLINERVTLSDAEEMARRSGLRSVEGSSSKEEFVYTSGQEFIESPLIADYFLDDWLSIVPGDQRSEIKGRIAGIIDRETGDGSFDVSIKATVVTGKK